MKILQAARLAEQSYAPSTITTPIVDSSPHEWAQGYMLEGGTLLLPGVNQGSAERIRYVYRFVPAPRRWTFPGVTDRPELHHLAWHRGVFEYATALAAWLDGAGHRPRRIIGHSLGAAGGQMIAVRDRVPMIGFGHVGVCHPNEFRGPYAHIQLVKIDNDIARMGWAGYLGTLGRVRPLPRVGNLPSIRAHRMPIYVKVLSKSPLGQAQAFPAPGGQ